MTRALRCDDFDTPHGYIPTKNISNPNLALLGPLGAQKRAETRPKCVVTMNVTQAEEPVAVGTKFGPRGPSWELWGPQKGQNWPFLGLRGPRRGPIPGQSVWLPCAQSRWTNRRQLGPNLAQGAQKRPFGAQMSPFLGPQECHRGPLRGQSA